jgi:hypothetical protein
MTLDGPGRVTSATVDVSDLKRLAAHATHVEIADIR